MVVFWWFGGGGGHPLIVSDFRPQSTHRYKFEFCEHLIAKKTLTETTVEQLLIGLHTRARSDGMDDSQMTISGDVTRLQKVRHKLTDNLGNAKPLCVLVLTFFSLFTKWKQVPNT